MLEGIEERT
jgi:hypothetical protein